MIIPMIFAILGFLALGLIIYLLRGARVKGSNLSEIAAQLRPIDVNAFRNLIDEGEERFLRKSLPAVEFWPIHRERMLAATEYVMSAAKNAGILIRLAEPATQDSDPLVVSAAQELLESATEVRLYALQVVPRFYVSMLLPWVGHSPYSLAERYAAMSRQMVTLGCLRSATEPTAVSN